MATNDKASLTKKHSALREALFRFKTFVLKTDRLLFNLKWPVKRFQHADKLVAAPVIAFSESDLHNPADTISNIILTAGKIENLRIAARYLDGIEVKANSTFSFWKHIGNPNFGKGYVIGREIREGCIVPTIAGGLCQLSNALYDAALKADFEILERHRHTQVIPGSLAEQDRDATVKWNYIDLRFRSDTDFRIEAELSADKLVVVFKSSRKNAGHKEIATIRKSDQLNDCYSCGNHACFKHPGDAVKKHAIARTAFVLDEKWIEYDEFIKGYAFYNDFFIIPLTKNRFVKTHRYDWAVKDIKNVRATTMQGLYRAIRLRLASKLGQNAFSLGLTLDRKIGLRAAKLIPLETTHVIVSQNLLPYLLEAGALGGRTFDVLMTRLPMEKLHERLDAAYAHHPDSKTLHDFRAPQELVILENRALTKAGKIITPHNDIAEIFKNKVQKLHWRSGDRQPGRITGSKILFPAPVADRKGAYLVKRLAQELNLSIVVGGDMKNVFWEGITTEPFNGSFDHIGLVVYPAFTEHQPRQLLKAIANDIPVIATSACGLDESPLVTLIELGNYEQLKKEIVKFLNS
jgi:hypothetical protein